MGRPSKTGLSVKILGVNEYQRRYSDQHRRRPTGRRWHTGLSRKALGDAVYRAALRRRVVTTDFEINRLRARLWALEQNPNQNEKLWRQGQQALAQLCANL